MNRNQKIALGCGGAGCLVLILIVVVGGILYMVGYVGSRSMNSNYNYNTNTNRNSNYNSSSNRNANNNSSASTLTTDEKHKLFQAAAATNDRELTLRVWRRLGFLNADGTPNENYAAFLKEHMSWLFRNSDFIQSINTPEKARAYVEEHMDD